MICGFESGDPGNISASHPIENVSHVQNLSFDGTAYLQLIIEFEDGVIVADAPPSQTLATINWVQENLNKSITHLWVSFCIMISTQDIADNFLT
jgi:hypothetical protein